MPLDYATQPENIKLDLEQRDDLVKRLKALWLASQEQKGDAPSGWWEEVEQMYRVESPDTVGVTVKNDRLSRKKQDKSGIQQFRLPQILHSRVNALNAQMATVITRQLRFVTATEGVPAEIARKKEILVHRLWMDGGFIQAVRKAGLTAALLNKAIWRIYPEYGDGYAGRIGVCIDAIHPKDFGCFPASVSGREDWQFTAHRIYRRQRVIKDQMAKGTYFDVTGNLVASDPSQSDETGMYRHSKTALAIQTSENDSRVVELVVGQVKLDLSKPDANGQRRGTEKWYRFVLSYDSDELLSLTPYGFSQPEYFSGHLMPELLAFWGGMSVGRMLYPIQDSVNKVVSAFYEMAMRTASPPIIGPELADGRKYAELPFGSYVSTDEPVAPWSQSVTPQLEPLNAYIIHAERWADQVARVSQNTLGTIAGRQTTATTDSIIAAGVQVGQEEYLGNFCLPFGEMARYTEEVAMSLYGDLVTYYGGRIGSETDEKPITPDEIALECSWEPTGRNPNATPMAKVADAMQLLEIAIKAPGFGYDQWTLGNVIAENSSLAGIQIQMSREDTQKMAEAAHQAEVEALEMEHRFKLEEIQAKADADEEKAHNDAQRTIVTNAAKSVVDAKTRPKPEKSAPKKAGRRK